MRIENLSVLRDFRGPGRCEACGLHCRSLEAHHWYCRGLGGGSRLDIRINLIALGGAFSCNCHGRAQHDREFNERLLSIIARREGHTPEWIRREIFRLLRTPKGLSVERE